MGINNFNARRNHVANHAMDLYSTLQGIDTASCFILLKPLSKCQPSVLPRIFRRPGGDSDCKKPGSFNRKSNELKDF